MTEQNNNGGIDFVGLGNLANAIPPDVYTRSAETLTNTFDKLLAPITEATDGLGRYVRQKFDSWVQTEKALATVALRKAVATAKRRAKEDNSLILSPAHPKSFVTCLAEASRETDSMLHDMWSGLIAAQLRENAPHPHFIQILTNFSPAEAKLLMQLRTHSEIGDNEGSGLFFGEESYSHWVYGSDDRCLKQWTLSSRVLKDFGLAHTAIPRTHDEDVITILYRTQKGTELLAMTDCDTSIADPDV